MLVAVFPNKDYFPLEEVPDNYNGGYYLEVPDNIDLDEYMEEYFLAVDLGSSCERSTVH